MFHKHALLSLTLIFAGGCFAKNDPGSEAVMDPPSNPPSNMDPPMTMDPPPPTDPLPSIVASSKARLRFKGGERYVELLSSGLAIPRAELCKELSLYDCAGEVHTIALGGVDAYENGIYEPMPNTA